MAWFATALPYIISAAGAGAAGLSAKQSADFEAKQLKQRAGQAKATSQFQAEQERRQSRYIQSRAQALAAASGAGASDKTVLDIMGSLEKEGEYRALSALYAGDVASQNDLMAASTAKQEGKNALVQSLFSAGGQLAKGYAGSVDNNLMYDDTSSLYNKYAMGLTLDSTGARKGGGYVKGRYG